MKKKHRDIVVDGQKYGWMLDGWNHVKIWKDKKIIAEYDIEYQHDSITPGMIAALIKDPKLALMWMNAKPCPFCGKLVEPVEHNDFFQCTHEEDCWIQMAGKPISIISQSKLETWNTRRR